MVSECGIALVNAAPLSTSAGSTCVMPLGIGKVSSDAADEELPPDVRARLAATIEELEGR